MKKKIGVLLAGSGVYDGSEIHEAVLTLLAIDRGGAEYVCMAPDAEQLHVINHVKGEPTTESRNILVESARIARGNIKDIASVSMDELDALVLPGGFGAAKNLCNFALKGADCEIRSDVAELIRKALTLKKPVGAACIAPTVVAKALSGTEFSAALTIGNDAGTAEAIGKMGSRHVDCAPGEMVVDEKLRIATTPAYMYDSNISQVAQGIEKMVAWVIAHA